jgi:hypothetical protein
MMAGGCDKLSKSGRSSDALMRLDAGAVFMIVALDRSPATEIQRHEAAQYEDHHDVPHGKLL